MDLLLIVLVLFEALLIVAIVLQHRVHRYDGSMVVTHTAEKKLFSLEIDRDPDTLDQRKRIVLQVKNFSEDGARE